MTDEVAPWATPQPSAAPAASPAPTAEVAPWASPAPAPAAPAVQAPQDEAASKLAQAKEDWAGPARLAEIGLRGLGTGVASLATAPFDAGVAATNFVKKHVFGYTKEDMLNTNASDVVNSGLDKLGVPTAKGALEKTVDIGANLIGGLAGGGLATRATGALADAAAGGPSAEAGTGGAGSFWNKASSASGTPNQAIVANAVGQQIGEPGVTKLTGAVLDRADMRISGVLDNVRGASRPFQGDHAAVTGQIASIAADTSPEVLNNPTVKKLLAAFEGTQGMVSTETLGNLSSQLGKAGKATISRDYELGQGLFKVKDQLEEMISEGLSGPEKQVYEAARGQYRALWGQLIPSGAVNPNGAVDGATLGRYLMNKDPEGYLLQQNKSPMYTAARLVHSQEDGPSLMNAMHQHSIFWNAVTRFAPTMAQRLQQQGLPAAGRALVNKPGFMTALGQEFQNANDHQ